MRKKFWFFLFLTTLSFIFPTMYHLLIFYFSMMSYKSLKLFTFFLGHPVLHVFIVCAVWKKFYFLEIGPVNQKLWPFKCMMLKKLNSNFLDWEDNSCDGNYSFEFCPLYAARALKSLKALPTQRFLTFLEWWSKTPTSFYPLMKVHSFRDGNYFFEFCPLHAAHA